MPESGLGVWLKGLRGGRDIELAGGRGARARSTTLTSTGLRPAPRRPRPAEVVDKLIAASRALRPQRRNTALLSKHPNWM